MSSDDRVAQLEERIAQLEHQMNQLKNLVDMRRDPFTFLCFESNLSELQEIQIYDLMDEVSKSIKDGKPMSHHSFEERIYEIVPRRRGSYSFAKTIVSTLNRSGRWPEVYQHMTANGMGL
jgi:penicillin-binding protein-related factor A (putative recombinase)